MGRRNTSRSPRGGLPAERLANCQPKSSIVQLHFWPSLLYALFAATKPGPFAEFYAELLAMDMRPEMARLTLARKIATIVLIVWKRGVCFDAQHLKPQTA